MSFTKHYLSWCLFYFPQTQKLYNESEKSTKIRKKKSKSETMATCLVNRLKISTLVQLGEEKTMLDLESKPVLSSLKEENKNLIASVDDYVLDYNLFVLNSVREVLVSNDNQLVSFIQALIASLPDEYSNLIYNPIDDNGKINLSTTSKLQERLLNLLIQERHRRDIIALNKQFEEKIKYLELENPFKYEIKSPYYKAFLGAKDEQADQFHKLALLQSLEYDFEHNLDEESDYKTDDDLLEHFLDDAIVNFKLDGNVKEEDVMNSEIVKIMLPLAAQVIMGDDDEVEDESELKESS